MPTTELTPEMRALLKRAPAEVINELAIMEQRAMDAEQRSGAAQRAADALRVDVARLRAENEILRVALREIAIDVECALTGALVKAAG